MAARLRLSSFFIIRPGAEVHEILDLAIRSLEQPDLARRVVTMEEEVEQLKAGS